MPTRLTQTQLEEDRPAPMDEKRKLTEYEKGYLDGLLAYAYRSDGEVYVGKGRFCTYEHAVTSFLRSRGIVGWKVKVH